MADERRRFSVMSSLFLNVPFNRKQQRERRRSEGSVCAFVSDGIQKRNGKSQKQTSQDVLAGDDKHKKLRFLPSLLDNNLIEVLRRNYDIVSALADIENNDERSSTPTSVKMKGPIPRIEMDDVPRPLVLRDHNPYKCHECESVSLSSTDSSGFELPAVSRSTWLRHELKSFLLDIIDSFEHPGDRKASVVTDNTKLSAVALKRDLKRCYTALHPFIEVAAALYDLLLWKNPISTLLLVLVYMFSIFRGWTATLVLLLLLLQLSLNYLSAIKNIDIGLSFLPRKEVPLPRFDISGAQLIFDIAKVAQQLLHFSADLLEKVHSLLTWKNEKVTRVFYYLVVYWLVLATVFNTGTCLGMCGMTIGIRIFFTTYLFERFPRLRKRLDTYGWFYRNLPVKSNTQQAYPMTPRTNDDEQQQQLHRCVTPGSSEKRRSTLGEIFTSRLGSNFNLDKPSPVQITQEENNFAENGSFSQNSFTDGEDEKDDTSSEDDPMIDNLVAFRSCVMNEKEKMFPKGISSGVLYLTDAALIFRARSTTEDKAPLMMLFHDIISVKKTHSLRSMSIIAGTRKSIEIVIAGRRKPLQFVGIVQRDEFVSRMETMCLRAESSTHFIVD